MENTIKTDIILAEIKQLDFPEKIFILEKIISLIKKDNIQKGRSKLSDLNHLGSEIWKNVDIDQYINKEREWD